MADVRNSGDGADAAVVVELGTEASARRSPVTAGAPQSGDVALGLVAASIQAALDASRVALMPARVAMRSPALQGPLRRVARDLAHQGSLARARGRARFEVASGRLLATPEVDRAVDRVLASPGVEQLVNRVLERRLGRTATDVADQTPGASTR